MEKPETRERDLNQSQSNLKPTRIKKLLGLLFGVACSLAMIIFLALSIPVYPFRIVVILLAKLFRPDLGEILNGQSSIFAAELFRKNPLRNNIILCMTIEKNTCVEDIKSAVWENWISAIDKSNGQLLYPKFQQYPVRWLGFTFYKHAFDTFSFDNHVFFHEEIGMDKPATEEDIGNLSEKILNAPFRPNTSLWEFHLVLNYVNPKITCAEPEMSVLLFKVHHSLADGYSLLKVFTDVNGGPRTDIVVPMPKLPKRSLLQKISSVVIGPLCVFYEMAVIMSNTIRPSPWRVPDQDKVWHQHCAKSDLIPLETILNIKNTYGLTFSSVVVSAISAGINKALESRKSNANKSTPDDESMYCLSALPLPGRNRNLTNYVTANVFDIPTIEFEDPLKRLHICHSILEGTKSTFIPYVAQYYGLLVGCHFSAVGAAIAKNRAVCAGITNFPGFQVPPVYAGKTCIHFDFIVGAMDGEAGVSVMVVSHHKHIRISATAEKSIMTRQEVEQFVRWIQEEIKTLHDKAQGESSG